MNKDIAHTQGRTRFAIPQKQPQGAFSLAELMVVTAIMGLMLGMTLVGLGNRVAGARQGAITQLMQSLEEARMLAIEKGTTVYFGLSDADHPDPDKQLRGYILFRRQTEEEKAESGTDDWVCLTLWQLLPAGFFFDADELADSTQVLPGFGLPGNPATVRAMKFDPLGQISGSAALLAPRLAVSEAVYDQKQKTLVPKGDGAGDFVLQLYRLTGRVKLTAAP